jgi:hypothetical protein
VNAGWGVMTIGVLIVGIGVVLISFRERISGFMSRFVWASPKTPATAIVGGSVFALFGAVVIWSGITQLL